MLSLILIILAATFFTGIIIRTKSIASGRKGPGIFQPIKDVVRLFKKGAVYSETSSFVFRIAPTIYFSLGIRSHAGSTVWCIQRTHQLQRGLYFLCVYTGTGQVLQHYRGHGYRQQLEGMGASREALYSMFAEPAFFYPDGLFGITDRPYFVSGDIFNTSPGSSITYALGALAILRVPNDCHD